MSAVFRTLFDASTVKTGANERGLSQYLYCMVCFFRKVFLKSDTAVALRRSKVPCIIVVSFINVYDEYFCKLMWLSAKSLHVLELLNITHQCKIRFLDTNMHFIEPNIHVLCNMKSYECHLMKIKG